MIHLTVCLVVFQISSLNGHSDFVKFLVNHGANKRVQNEVTVNLPSADCHSLISVSLSVWCQCC